MWGHKSNQFWQRDRQRCALGYIFGSKIQNMAMHIDDQLISRLETLTRLKLSEEERTHVKKDLARILDMIDQLGTLDLDAVLPLTHITEVVNNWRADEVRGQVTREEALRNAPDTDDVFFRVPKVLPDKGA